MKALVISLWLVVLSTLLFAQEDSGNDTLTSISKLEIKKGDKKTFAVKGRDSTLTLKIDTLIMGDRAALEFFGKKDVTIEVGHAVIPNEAYITGTDSKNNGTNMDITIRFEKLGSLFVLAGGRDANNGSRTHPNGDGGNVHFKYLSSGIQPQQDKKGKSGYLRIDTKAGGYRVNPQTDLYNIYSQISMGIMAGGGRLGSVPQGQIYSGSPGKDGEANVQQIDR